MGRSQGERDKGKEDATLSQPAACPKSFLARGFAPLFSVVVLEKVQLEREDVPIHNGLLFGFDEGREAVYLNRPLHCPCSLLPGGGPSAGAVRVPIKPSPAPGPVLKKYAFKGADWNLEFVVCSWVYNVVEGAF